MVDIKKNEALKFVAANTKIMDITGSTATFVSSIAASVPPNTVAVILCAQRMSGTGVLYLYPNEGTLGTYITDLVSPLLYALKAGFLNVKYKQSVAADDFDLYLLGYLVEGPVGT